MRRPASVVEKRGDSRTGAEEERRHDDEPGELKYGGLRQRRRNRQMIGVHAQQAFQMLRMLLVRFGLVNVRGAYETGVQQANEHDQRHRPRQ